MIFYSLGKLGVEFEKAKSRLAVDPLPLIRAKRVTKINTINERSEFLKDLTAFKKNFLII
jgi:hypothetical protein